LRDNFGVFAIQQVIRKFAEGIARGLTQVLVAVVSRCQERRQQLRGGGLGEIAKRIGCGPAQLGVSVRFQSSDERLHGWRTNGDQSTAGHLRFTAVAVRRQRADERGHGGRGVGPDGPQRRRGPPADPLFLVAQGSNKLRHRVPSLLFEAGQGLGGADLAAALRLGQRLPQGRNGAGANFGYGTFGFLPFIAILAPQLLDPFTERSPVINRLCRDLAERCPR